MTITSPVITAQVRDEDEVLEPHRLFDSAILGSWPWPAHYAGQLPAATGFTNKDLRVLIAGLLGGA